MTDTMRAVEISEPGGPEVLCLTTRPVPQPGHGEVVIEVAWAGVNRPDALQRAGRYAPPEGASDLPGLEASSISRPSPCPRTTSAWSSVRSLREATSARMTAAAYAVALSSCL